MFQAITALTSSPAFNTPPKNQWIIEDTDKDPFLEILSKDQIKIGLEFNSTNRLISTKVFGTNCIDTLDSDSYFSVGNSQPVQGGDSFIQFNSTLIADLNALNTSAYWTEFGHGRKGGYFQVCVETGLLFDDEEELNGSQDEMVTFKSTLLNVSVSLNAAYEVQEVSVAREDPTEAEVGTDYSAYVTAFECDENKAEISEGDTYNQGDQISICVTDQDENNDDVVEVDEFVDLVGRHSPGGSGVQSEAVLSSRLNMSCRDCQYSVGIKRELSVKFLRTCGTRREVVQVKFPENVVVFGQWSFT